MTGKKRPPPRRPPRAGDPWNSPEFNAYVTHVVTDLVPMMQGSAIVISMVPKSAVDVKFGIELGFSIMMDKPIMAVVHGDTPIPGKLRAVADEIVVVDDLDSTEARAAVTAGMLRMRARFPDVFGEQDE